MSLKINFELRNSTQSGVKASIVSKPSFSCDSMLSMSCLTETVSELNSTENNTHLCSRGLSPIEETSNVPVERCFLYNYKNQMITLCKRYQIPPFLVSRKCVHRLKSCNLCKAGIDKYLDYVCNFDKIKVNNNNINNNSCVKFLSSELLYLKDFLNVGLGNHCPCAWVLDFYPQLKGLNEGIVIYLLLRLEEFVQLEINLSNLMIDNSRTVSFARPCEFTVKRRGVIEKVNKRTFLSLKGRVERTKRGWVKLLPESLGSVGNVLSGLRKVVSILDILGSRSPDTTISAVDKAYDIFKLVLDSLCCYNSGGSLISVIRLLISTYEVFNNHNTIQAQSLDAVALSALSMLLPKHLLEIIKRMSVFTSAKLLDDPSYFSEVFTCVLEFLSVLVKDIPVFGPKLVSLLKCLPFSRSHLNLKLMQTSIAELKKDKTAILSSVYREKILRTYKAIEVDASMVEWSRRSLFVKNTIDDFKGLYKMVLSYGSVRRVEPICIAFEGPPGVFKSVLMNQLVDVFRQDPLKPKTVYSHSIRSVMDGKDFYDTYNNEDVFVMDDLGQQGISQFRNIINWVSEVKYPLECAEAKLKNTKFFNSELILFTTNQFQTLTNFSKDDCISNPAALFRRTKVFDFSNVKRFGDVLTGNININIFHEPSNSYRTLETIDCATGKTQILRKMRQNVNSWLDQNRQFNMLNDLSPEELHEIYAQGFDTIIEEETEEDTSPVLTPKDSSWIDNAIHIVTSMFTFDCLEAFMTKETLVRAGIGIVLFTVLGFLRDKFSASARMQIDPQVVSMKEMLSMLSTKPRCSASSVIMALQKNVKPMRITTDEETKYVLGLVSGHCIIFPSHYTDVTKVAVSVFTDATMTQMVWDQTEVNQIYRNNKEDLVVYISSRSIATPFKNISHLLSLEGVANLLVSPANVIDVSSIMVPSKDYTYSTLSALAKNPIVFNLEKSNNVSYELGGTGMCGSLICDPIRGLRGMHVAGLGTTLGVGVIWSKSTMVDLQRILKEDVDYIIDVEFKEKTHLVDPISGCYLESSVSTSVVSKTNLVPSPLYGHLPNFKYPPNFKAFGSDTIKVMGSKSLSPVKYIDSIDLKFAEDWLRSSVESFTDITLKEVILGNSELSGLNKKSSNGIGFPGPKNEYIDYAVGSLTPKGETEYLRISSDLEAGKCKISDHLWMECLKDEPRLLEKVNKPRSFRCCNVVLQVLTKEIFGSFVAQIQRDKWHNGVMIGMNPLTDFDRLFKRFSSCKLKWGGDFKSFDGGMLTQLQETLAKVVVSFYKGKYPKIASFILVNMAHTPVIMKDELILTSHSMPSGSFLTALVNSLINRMLTACWYSYVMRHNNFKYSVSSFVKHIIDSVYGDDKITAPTEHEDILHMMSMAAYFDHIGLGFTNSKKGPCLTPGEDWKDITFLKREFVFSPKFGKILCPLDPITMYSSLNWLDCNKDMAVVLNDKLGAFQREAHLHGPEIKKEMMKTLTDACEAAGIPLVVLPDHYLDSLIFENDFSYLDYSYLYV